MRKRNPEASANETKGSNPRVRKHKNTKALLELGVAMRSKTLSLARHFAICCC